MKKLLLAAALAACFVSAGAGADEIPKCGNFSAEVQEQINAQAAVNAALRKAASVEDNDAGERIGAPRVDIKALSCVDKYKKMKIVVAFPWPSVDMLFDKLQNMACNYIDQNVNELTNKVGMNKNLPYGLGNVGAGIGQGSGSGSNNGYYEIDKQNRDVSGRVLDGLFN